MSAKEQLLSLGQGYDDLQWPLIKRNAKAKYDEELIQEAGSIRRWRETKAEKQCSLT
jgi:hypothetical protein